MAVAVLMALVAMAVLLVPVAVASGATTPGATAGASAPYLIFHLDGVSSQTFFSELDAGRLPNIASAFAGGIEVRHALSLFVGGTAMIYPRLKTGQGSEASFPVCLVAYDRASGRVIGQLEALRTVLSFLPGLSRDQWLYGAPGLEALAGWAMLNIPRALREHGIVEFLWLSTDGSGHLFGEEAQRRSLRTFDRCLGFIRDALAATPLNLVLYADHGMSFPTLPVELEPAVRRVLNELGDAARFYSYPNVYLNEPGRAEAVAKALAGCPGVDFAFYRMGGGMRGTVDGTVGGRTGSRVDGAVAGWHKAGRVVFEPVGTGLRFSHEGPDPFGYDRLGYDGSALSDDDWLRLTAASPFPAVPPNIYHYMANPLAGDVVIVSNPPNLPRFTVTRHGSHAGMTATDLLVPVLLKGPDVCGPEVRGRLVPAAGPGPAARLELGPASQAESALWLHRLYTEVLRIDPTAAERGAPRLGTSWARIPLTGAAAGIELALALPAPAPGWPGWRLEAARYGRDSWHLLMERDVAATLLGRLSVGAGLAAAGGSQSSTGTRPPTGTQPSAGSQPLGPLAVPAVSVGLRIYLGPLSLELLEVVRPTVFSEPGFRQTGIPGPRLSWELRPGLSLTWAYPSTLGITAHW